MGCVGPCPNQKKEKGTRRRKRWCLKGNCKGIKGGDTAQEICTHSCSSSKYQAGLRNQNYNIDHLARQTRTLSSSKYQAGLRNYNIHHLSRMGIGGRNQDTSKCNYIESNTSK